MSENVIMEFIERSNKIHERYLKTLRLAYKHLFGEKVEYKGTEYIIIGLYTAQKTDELPEHLVYEPRLLLANSFLEHETIPLIDYIKFELAKERL